MGKSRDSKKATKKAPAKTAKEKKAEKRLKKANRQLCKLKALYSQQPFHILYFNQTKWNVSGLNKGEEN